MVADSGHQALIKDLKILLLEAENFEYDDFKNTKHATPKVALYKKLIRLANNVKEGRYDQ